MAAAFLQLEHHFRQAFVSDLILYFFAVTLRNLKVLAIDASQIAVAKKYVAGAFGPDQGGFFAKVRGVRRHYRQST